MQNAKWNPDLNKNYQENPPLHPELNINLEI